MKFVFTLIDTENPLRKSTELNHPCDYELTHVFPQEVDPRDIFRFVNMNFDLLKVGDVIVHNCDTALIISDMNPLFAPCDLSPSWKDHMNNTVMTLGELNSIYRILSVKPEQRSVEDRINLAKQRREENEMKQASRIRGLEI